MKVVKKMFYIFLAVAFFIQSCAFSYVSAQGTPVGGSGGYEWTSSVEKNGNCDGSGIKSVSVNESGGQLNWTIELADDTFNLGYGAPLSKRGIADLYFEIQYKTGISEPKTTVGNIKYSSSFNNKPLDFTSNGQQEPIITGVINKTSQKLTNQKITFTTSNNLNTLDLSLVFKRYKSKLVLWERYETCKTITLKVTKSSTPPPEQQFGVLNIQLAPKKGFESLTAPTSATMKITTIEGVNEGQSIDKKVTLTKGFASEKIPVGKYKIKIIESNQSNYVFEPAEIPVDINTSQPTDAKFTFSKKADGAEESGGNEGIGGELTGHNPFNYLYTYTAEQIRNLYSERDQNGNITPATYDTLYGKWIKDNKYKEVYPKESSGATSLSSWLTDLHNAVKQNAGGTYPINFTNPPNADGNGYNSNIRNVNTTNVPGNKVNSETKTKDNNDKKLEYNDSILGKWAESTDKEDEYYVNLTIEGKGYSETVGTDIVFVLDNSHSMMQNFSNNYKWMDEENHEHLVKYGNSKIYSLYSNMVTTVNSILNENNTPSPYFDANNPKFRVGIVNYSTLIDPVQVPTYAKGKSHGVKYPGDTLGVMGDIINAINNVYTKDKDLEQYRPDQIYNLYPGNPIKSSEHLTDYFSSRRIMPLTTSKMDVFRNLPIIPRGTGFSGGDAGEGYPDGANMWAQFDGLTNTAVGIHAGTQVLYPDNNPNKRNKILVLVTDGIPTASFRLNNLNMPGDTFETNLKKEAVKDEYYGNMTSPLMMNLPKSVKQNQLPALITTNSVPYLTENAFNETEHKTKSQYAIYNDVNGTTVFNNLQGTTAVRNFYANKYQDMRIMGLLIGPPNYGGEFGLTNGFYSCGKTNGKIDINKISGTGNSSSYPEPNKYIESLTTGGITGNDFYTAADANQISESLKNIKNVLIKTITNGTAVDPIGSQFSLAMKDPYTGNIGTHAPSDSFTEGYSLEDNEGNYLMLTTSNHPQAGVGHDHPENFVVFDKSGQFCMDKDGVIYSVVNDKKGNKVSNQNDSAYDALKKSYLKGVSVQIEKPQPSTVGEHGKILINHLYLGKGQEVHLKYRVRLIHDSQNTKDKLYQSDIRNYKDDTFFQMNKPTYLVPSIEEDKYCGTCTNHKKELFPLPSAMLSPVKPPPSELPSTGGISFGASSIALITMGMMVCYYVYIKNIKRT